MSSDTNGESRANLWAMREWLSRALRVKPDRKCEIYLSLCDTATLSDTSYWLHILFSAGIATLGLVLNSPAVIIGAMLISPLMGPILALGLSMATGDYVLGLRAFVSLTLSCIVAILFAALLVTLLPFKEITNEITSRIRPTTLDLAVALFSGAIGTIATAKEARGIVTSIPGVAIAVALMPPLCVVGYGMGIYLTVEHSEGLRAFTGGGLLFLTNLVGITFTAMIIFLALHINTAAVRRKMLERHESDPESKLVKTLIDSIPIPERVKRASRLPARIIAILVVVGIILIPLSRSFSDLKQEIVAKQAQNLIIRTATNLWVDEFGKEPNGSARSSVDTITPSEQQGKLTLSIRVFTAKPLSMAERNAYLAAVSAALERKPGSVGLQLTEIPTTSGQPVETAAKAPPPPPSVSQLERSLMQTASDALATLALPTTTQMIGLQIQVNLSGPFTVVIAYLSDHDLSDDAVSVITTDVRARLATRNALVVFRRVPTEAGSVTFRRGSSALTAAADSTLDHIGQWLKQYQSLDATISATADRFEGVEKAQDRAQAVTDYLVKNWAVSKDRITQNTAIGTGRQASVTVGVGKGGSGQSVQPGQAAH